MSASVAQIEATEPSPVESYRAGALMSLLRLRWFIRVRWGFTFVGLAVLAVEHFARPTVERPVGLVVVVLCTGVVNAGYMALSRMRARRFQDFDVGEAEAIRSARVFANAQVATDLLLLTLILRYTGGIESPIAIFYTLHMAIGSLLLSPWQALLQGVWAVVLYAGLGFGELVGWIAPHHAFLPSVPHAALFARSEFVCGAVLVVAGGVFGTLYLMLRIATRLDNSDRRLRGAMAALRQSQNALQEILVRRSRFMQTAAHQLKSPLTGIQLLAGLIRDGTVQGKDAKATSEKIVRRCRDGIASVAELLTMARVLDADPRRHGEAVADVGSATEDICRRRALQAEEKGINLSCQVPDGLDLQAHVDHADLVDCVDNLVDNAIKYTPEPGSVKVTVTRRGLEEVPPDSATEAPGRGEAGGTRGFVTVTVTDTGIGLNADELPGAKGPSGAGSVFDPFRRGVGALTAGIHGSGLGLSIVRTVVEQASGRINVHSRPGEGSKFTVMFPARETPRVDAGSRDRAAESMSKRNRGGS